MCKTTLITGGTRGIGRALVEEYLSRGFHVATFSSNPNNAERLISDYSANKNLYVESFNITDTNKGREFVKRVLEKYDQIDNYIFNNGICEDKTFEKMSSSQWNKVLDVNLNATFDITQSVFQQMKRQIGSQKMFFMTSLAGIEGAFGQANYAASKAGLIGLTKSLALEGKRYDIEVNAISPAALTDMTKPIIEKIALKCQKENQTFPNYWKIGSAKDVAESIYQLSEITVLGSGQTFALNGKKIEVYEQPSKKIFSIGENQ